MNFPEKNFQMWIWRKEFIMKKIRRDRNRGYDIPNKYVKKLLLKEYSKIMQMR